MRGGKVVTKKIISHMQTSCFNLKRFDFGNIHTPAITGLGQNVY